MLRYYKSQANVDLSRVMEFCDDMRPTCTIDTRPANETRLMCRLTHMLAHVCQRRPSGRWDIYRVEIS